MATDPDTLLENSKCYGCYTPGEWQLMMLALLRRIALDQNSMAAVDPQSLLTQAQCYQCYGSGGTWTLMMLALLAQIANNGGAGQTCLTCLAGGATPVDPAPCDCSIAYNANGQVWAWDSLLSSWNPIIL